MERVLVFGLQPEFLGGGLQSVGAVRIGRQVARGLFELVCGARALQVFGDLVLHLFEVGDARVALLDEHGDCDAVLDADAVADLIRLFQGLDGVLKLRAAADVGHVVAGLDEGSLPDHLGRSHVRFRREFLRDLVDVFAVLQTILGLLREGLRRAVGLSVAHADQKLLLRVLEGLRDGRAAPEDVVGVAGLQRIADLPLLPFERVLEEVCDVARLAARLAVQDSFDGRGQPPANLRRRGVFGVAARLLGELLLARREVVLAYALDYLLRLRQHVLI